MGDPNFDSFLANIYDTSFSRKKKQQGKLDTFLITWVIQTLTLFYLIYMTHPFHEKKGSRENWTLFDYMGDPNFDSFLPNIYDTSFSRKKNQQGKLDTF